MNRDICFICITIHVKFIVTALVTINSLYFILIYILNKFIFIKNKNGDII